MFYRRKFYIVKNEFIVPFNRLFNGINLPNQLKHGALPHNKETTEIFAIWEYDSYEAYLKIEDDVRSDIEHLKRIRNWYDEHGRKEYVQKHYFLEARNEKLLSTISLNKKTSSHI